VDNAAIKMNSKVMGVLSELRSRFNEIYGDRLSRLVLFGSQARGDAEDGSDIDILLVLKGEVKAGEEISRIGEFTSALSLKNNVVISCVFMPEERFLHRNGPLLRNVRREGITL